ncbi:MAG: peptide-methionine (R)-S-oxide reductase MsrB [Pseudomonadota bacterium]
MVTRRNFLTRLLGGATALAATGATVGHALAAGMEKLMLSEAQWRKRLKPAVYRVLRREATEPPFSSPLNDEKRTGVYHCAGCDLALFSSDTKYDSRTGWPSFYDVIEPARIGTKTDYYIGYPRTEYHCAKCGGHQGHVFKDGPAPTGLRYCNNGLALTFKPKPGAA